MDQIQDSTTDDVESSMPTQSGTALPPPAPNVSGRHRSMVWDHFTRIPNGDPSKPRAKCNYCTASYACDTKTNGTKSMKYHIEKQCKKCPFNRTDKSQTTLAWKAVGGSDSGELVSIAFSVDACRQSLAEMIILDELPFRFVEGEGFKKFMLTVCPKWVTIPSRVTVAKDCFSVYTREKNKLRSALQGQRISLTTDTWTSVQNLNYMCLTAHFIDDDWNLHKRILSFCLVENHKGDTLGKAIEMCLHDWGRPKYLAITLDNASSNNGAVSYLKKKTKYRKDTILEHEFLHVRCCAHILNLIVCEGLREFDESIAKVRGVVKYVKSSPQRWSMFGKCIQLEEITCKSDICLDVPTRWNSTYLMLERAIKFRRAFEQLEEEDSAFLTSIGDDDDDDEEDVEQVMNRRTSRKLGPPNNIDWEKVRLFVKFLKLFHDATLRFSEGLYATCNSFFLELATISGAIDMECQNQNLVVGLMATNMKKKFNKYWGNLDNMNMLLFVGILLDPRYKMRYLDFELEVMYAHDPTKAVDLSCSVKNTLTRMYEAYLANEDVSNSLQQQQQPRSLSREDVNLTGEDGASTDVDVRAQRMAIFQQLLQSEDSLESKSEVDRYLDEKCETDSASFDILVWWKVNSFRYRVLSKIARDVLAIPVSTVASESCFSTAGRVLDPFRSSLSPMMVEGLICTQNWLRSSSTPISLRTIMDDVEDFERQLEMGVFIIYFIL
ncbi:hypothetical protein CIPAW_06G145100 [Carya illinoinensis]|uniref:BED-type domain-containing protein n=1 Tax=Carya illinoinensis TaxID=32201 RepID=A0A8T1QBX3_CARIL|nr:hypothetical protein CIPAW_06G145100 [Carya illinoinensis]